MNEPSVFTNIFNNPSERQILFQDDKCFVILTHEPMTPGHLMVIPIEQIDHLWDVDDELYQHLMKIARKMALRLREVYDYKRIGMLVEGFGVPHAHIHVLGLDEGFAPLISAFHLKENKMKSPEELRIEAEKIILD